MSQINYIIERDELEIVFEEVDVPEIVQLSSGIILEFNSDKLTTIILPNFFQMIHRQPSENIDFTLISFNETLLKIKVDEQIVNVKLDLTELENK